MPRMIDESVSPKIESFLTHPKEQMELAAQMPWWGWAAIGVSLYLCGLMIWYFWPKKDPNAGLPRDEEGRLIPPWKWEDKGQGGAAKT